jgi:hypothetical protein
MRDEVKTVFPSFLSQRCTLLAQWANAAAHGEHQNRQALIFFRPKES